MKKLKPKTRKLLIVIAAVFGLTIIILAILEFTNTINLFGKDNPQQETTDTQDQQAESEDYTEANTPTEPEVIETPPTDEDDNKTSASSGSVNSVLSPANSTFVSAHDVSLTGNPQLESVCVTSPKTNCVIIFQNGSTTKQLPAKTTDGEGAAYWSWKLTDYGIGVGNWKVSAKATKNGESKTASDALELRVSK